MTDKKRTEADWQDIRVFLALGRYGSLSAAARALSVNHATVSRRLRSLEASMGEKLVKRRPGGYALTAAGTRALAIAGEMETAARTLGRAPAVDLPQGLVRINAPPALAQGFLISRLAELPGRYPNLDVELATNLRSISLDRHQADIAVRLGRPEDGNFIAKLLGRMAFGYYATPAVCRRIDDGAPPVFVGFDEENADLPEAVWLARHHPQARVAFRSSNQFAQATAARQGAGAALLPHYIARLEPDLRPCRLEPVPAPREIWVLMRRQNRKDLAIKTVVEHLLRMFAAEREAFEP